MTLPALIVVLHETLLSIKDSLLLHADPKYLASYHAVISRTGEIHYLVPADCKAYAAANSKFINTIGEEEHVNNSVDDFAYHIALETPEDGFNALLTRHSGYTTQQYDCLAWLLRATGVDLNRIITHGELKTPKQIEPRCLNEDYLFNLYTSKNNKVSLNFGILDNTNIING